jgi:uncharacterized protein (DUF2267 family)
MAFSWEGLDMKFEEFIGSVAERAGVSTEEAEPLARAALRTLAERITGGEARDLAAQLPIPLQNPLLAVTEEEAEPFGLDEFIRRTASVRDSTATRPRSAYTRSCRPCAKPLPPENSTT